MDGGLLTREDKRQHYPVLFYPPRRQTHGLHALPACVDAWVHAWLDSALDSGWMRLGSPRNASDSVRDLPAGSSASH